MKFLFCGNRIGILNTMLLMKLDVHVIPIFSTKKEMVEQIIERKFDIFVSNGCPYILPISKMKKENQIFVNIHPSLLPDLKGNSPILGAIKYNRDFGATCHLMDDGIDTGLIISQVRFYPDRNDLNDCYRKSYRAESQAFVAAYNRKFKPMKIQPKCIDPIYFSTKEVYGTKTV